MAKCIRPEDLNEAQIRAELDKEFQRWDEISRNGCSDPIWPDGVNMNLVRNHIIYWYGLLREKMERPVQLSVFETGMDLWDERTVPPKVPDNYMAPGGKYPDRLCVRNGWEITHSMEART